MVARAFEWWSRRPWQSRLTRLDVMYQGEWAELSHPSGCCGYAGAPPRQHGRASVGFRDCGGLVYEVDFLPVEAERTSATAFVATHSRSAGHGSGWRPRQRSVMLPSSSSATSGPPLCSPSPLICWPWPPGRLQSRSRGCGERPGRTASASTRPWTRCGASGNHMVPNVPRASPGASRAVKPGGLLLRSPSARPTSSSEGDCTCSRVRSRCLASVRQRRPVPRGRAEVGARVARRRLQRDERAAGGP